MTIRCEGIKGRRCTTHTECHPSGVSTCASVIVAFDVVFRRSKRGWAGTVDHSKATWFMPDSTPRRPWIMPDSISKSIVAASPSMVAHHSEHQTTAPCLQHTTSVYRVLEDFQPPARRINKRRHLYSTMPMRPAFARPLYDKTRALPRMVRMHCYLQ